MDKERTDMELIAAYLDGDASSFEQLYGRHKKLLYSYLNGFFENARQNVDDVFQQTWLKAIDNLNKYQDREKFTAWLMRIAHNVAIDQIRRGKRLAETDFDESLEGVLPAPESFAPDYDIESADLGGVIQDALAELTPEQKEVFLMRQEDISFKDIAEMQRCSINTCLARMQYALKNLRRMLETYR